MIDKVYCWDRAESDYYRQMLNVATPEERVRFLQQLQMRLVCLSMQLSCHTATFAFDRKANDKEQLELLRRDGAEFMQLVLFFKEQERV